MRRSILFLAFIFLCLTAHAQKRFVQFIVIGLDNLSECRQLQDSVKVHEGFESVRAEFNTRNFLAVYDGQLSYSEADFSSWLAPLGMTFICYRSGLVGMDEIVRLRAGHCGESSLEPRK